MNVEAQAIDVPTGVQDYRPALYGGVSAVELGVNGIRRVQLPVRIRSSSRGSCSPTPAPPATPASTTGRSPSGTSTATARCRRASRASATSRSRCAPRSSGATGPRSAATSRRSGRIASASRPASRRRRSTRCSPRPARPARWAARCAAPAAAVACSASARPTACRQSPRRWPRTGARVLDFRIEAEGLRVETRLAMQHLGQSCHRPRPRRDRRPTRNQGGEPVQDSRIPQRRPRRWPTRPRASPDLTPRATARDSRHRKRPRRQDWRTRRRPAPSPTIRSCSQEFPPTILDMLHLQGVGSEDRRACSIASCRS